MSKSDSPRDSLGLNPYRVWRKKRLASGQDEISVEGHYDARSADEAIQQAAKQGGAPANELSAQLLVHSEG